MFEKKFFRHSVVSDFLMTHGLLPARIFCPWAFPGKNTGVGCHFLLQGIFLTQGPNPSLLHWQADSLLLVPPEQPTFQSVQFSCSGIYDPLRPHRPQHTRPSCPWPTTGVYWISCPLSAWCHLTVSSSVVSSSCPQSYPASGSFQMSQLFTSGGQNTGVSASTSVLPVKTQDWSPLGWTGWNSLQSKRLSRVYSNTTVQKHQFFGTQLSL